MTGTMQLKAMMTLPEYLEVEGNDVIILGETCPILKRKKATDGQTVGILGKGLTEYIYFNYRDETYIGYFGKFFGKYQIKMPRKTAKIEAENCKVLVIPKRAKIPRAKGMAHGHSSIDRLDRIKCYSFETYDYDNETGKIMADWRANIITMREMVSRMDAFKAAYKMEMERRAELEAKDKEDFCEKTEIKRATIIAGKRIEVA